MRRPAAHAALVAGLLAAGLLLAAMAPASAGGARWLRMAPAVMQTHILGGLFTEDTPVGVQTLCDDVAAEEVMATRHGQSVALVIAGSSGCVIGDQPVQPASLVLVDPARSAIRATLALPAPIAALAVHPTAGIAYLAQDGLIARRGVLHLVDVRDPDKPRWQGTVPLAAGIQTTDLAVSPDGGSLYAATGTHTMVLDLSDPDSPVSTSRIHDYMVRNHTTVQVADVTDTFFGVRRFLTVGARLGGGAGCTTGALHVYDISSDIGGRPLMVAESEIPDHDLAAGQVAGEDSCPVAHATLDRSTRHLRVDWTVGGDTVSTDWFPYDTTAVFRATADFCTLVTF